MITYLHTRLIIEPKSSIDIEQIQYSIIMIDCCDLLFF